MHIKRLVSAVSLTALAGLGWTIIARPNYSFLLARFPSIKHPLITFGARPPASMGTVHSSSPIPFSDLLAGQQVPSEIVSPLGLSLDASGDLRGTLTASIDHNNSHTIVGGNWKLIVNELDADGNSKEIGSLEGTFSSGTVNLDANGKAASINTAQLIVKSGAGRYVSITTGTGTLEGVFDADGPKPFKGTLLITF